MAFLWKKLLVSDKKLNLHMLWVKKSFKSAASKVLTSWSRVRSSNKLGNEWIAASMDESLTWAAVAAAVTQTPKWSLEHHLWGVGASASAPRPRAASGGGGADAAASIGALPLLDAGVARARAGGRPVTSAANIDCGARPTRAHSGGGTEKRSLTPPRPVQPRIAAPPVVRAKSRARTGKKSRRRHFSTDTRADTKFALQCLPLIWLLIFNLDFNYH